MSLLDKPSDELINLLIEEEYSKNPILVYTLLKKVGTKDLVETGLRASKGEVLKRIYGSVHNFSRWDKILLSSSQFSPGAIKSIDEINLDIILGKRSKKPLKLKCPILFTGMSYGGSLNKSMKLINAKASTIVGTLTNTGESAVNKDIRGNANILIGQYNRAYLCNDDDNLRRLDAIEIQFGQGAIGGGIESITNSETIDDELRNDWNLKDGDDCKFYSRFKNINTKDDIISKVSELRTKYEVPIGIKISGNKYIEKDLELICAAMPDYICIDGAEGGTSDTPVTLVDNLGLPTMASLHRTYKYLIDNNLKNDIDLIIAGGLTNPGDYLKALALGADACYIGTIAVLAGVMGQADKTIIKYPPTQLVLQDGILKDKLDVDKAVQCLVNYIESCKKEMILSLQALGKRNLNELNRSDLVSIDKELSEDLEIDYQF